jgi:hypothetical protein
MQLPSAADLVRAFVADLGNVLQSGETTPVVAVSFTWNTSAIVLSYTPERDYTLVGVSAHAGVMISTNPALTFANVTASNIGPR